MRDERHKMVEVDLDDFDEVEVMGQDSDDFGVDDGFFQTTTTTSTTTTTTTTATATTKEINVEDSLRELHQKGLITRQEMAEMMTLLNQPLSRQPSPPVVKKRKRPKKARRPRPSSAIPFALEQPRQHAPLKKATKPSSAIPFAVEQPRRQQQHLEEPTEDKHSYSYVEIRLGNSKQPKVITPVETYKQHSSTPRSMSLVHHPATPRLDTPRPVTLRTEEPFESLRMDNPFIDPFTSKSGHLVKGPEFLPPIGALPKASKKPKPFTRHLTTPPPYQPHKVYTTTYYTPPSSSSSYGPREPFEPPSPRGVKTLGRRGRPVYGTKTGFPRQNKSLKNIHVASKGLTSAGIDVPDFTTAAPFPYDPTPTRTGHTATDLTMEDIRQSFLHGERAGTAFTSSIY